MQKMQFNGAFCSNGQKFMWEGGYLFMVRLTKNALTDLLIEIPKWAGHTVFGVPLGAPSSETISEVHKS